MLLRPFSAMMVERNCWTSSVVVSFHMSKVIVSTCGRALGTLKPLRTLVMKGPITPSNLVLPVYFHSMQSTNRQKFSWIWIVTSLTSIVVILLPHCLEEQPGVPRWLSTMLLSQQNSCWNLLFGSARTMRLGEQATTGGLLSGLLNGRCIHWYPVFIECTPLLCILLRIVAVSCATASTLNAMAWCASIWYM